MLSSSTTQEKATVQPVYSVLAKAAKVDLVLTPFPHIVIKNALPEDYYQLLANSFPAQEVFTSAPMKSNTNYRIPARDVIAENGMPAHWQAFMAYHTSAAFFNEVVALFAEQLPEILPDLQQRLGCSLSALDIKQRTGEGDARAGEGLMDCQFAHTSAVVDGSVKTSSKPHTDRECALYAGLLYMRDPSDDSAGGDLNLYSVCKPLPYRRSKAIGAKVADRYLQVEKQLAYGANTLALFIHHPAAIHGVTPRQTTAYPRRYINFLCECATELFDYNSISRGRRWWEKPR